MRQKLRNSYMVHCHETRVQCSKALYIFRSQQNLALRCFAASCKMSRFTCKSAPRLPQIEGGGGLANQGNAHIQTVFLKGFPQCILHFYTGYFIIDLDKNIYSCISQILKFRPTPSFQCCCSYICHIQRTSSIGKTKKMAFIFWRKENSFKIFRFKKKK